MNVNRPPKESIAMVSNPTTDWINPSLHAWLQAQEMMMDRAARRPAASTEPAPSRSTAPGESGEPKEASPVKRMAHSTA